MSHGYPETNVHKGLPWSLNNARKMHAYPFYAGRMASTRFSVSLGRLVSPDSGRIGSGIWYRQGGPERGREGGADCLGSSTETRTSKAKYSHATAPCSAGSEAAVSTTRHSHKLVGKCGRVVENQLVATELKAIIFKPFFFSFPKKV